MLSDSPPDRDLDWTESGIEGAWRYVNRLWRLSEGVSVERDGSALQGGDSKLTALVHKTINFVTDDLEKFHFNKAVARIRELTNFLEKARDAIEPGQYAGAMDIVVRLINPMMPHLAEEVWERMGHLGMVADTSWPVADPRYLVDETVTVAVQVNGKLKGTIELTKDCTNEFAEIEALKVENVVTAMAGKAPQKIIVVSNRIVNVVI